MTMAFQEETNQYVGQEPSRTHVADLNEPLSSDIACHTNTVERNFATCEV